jgi:large subunit ribosomal protein L1
MHRGKKWLEMIEKVDRTRLYDPADAAGLVREVGYTKFDGTIEASVKLGYKSYQNVRGIVKLPHGTGKQVRVLVFAKEDRHNEAKEAGADFVGAQDLVEKIMKESWTDFDACVATPDMMKDVGKLGPVLGRKGLMPKPKAGTVTNDIALAIKNLKSGQMEYKPDKTGVIHLGIGLSSFDKTKIEENLRAFYQAIIRDKPADAKGEYVKSLYVAPTMGPGIRINIRGLGA